MSKAILFDLDGTLLPVDTHKFVEHYTNELIPYIQDYFNPKEFIKLLWASTNEMMNNDDPNLTNEEVFTKHFLEKSKLEKDTIWPVFDKFYENHFPRLKKYSDPSTISREIVQIAKEQGRKVVIATNPVFPEVAIYERLRWLELDDIDFDLVTTYESSHFCKPQINFFKEILDKVGVSPDEAIMVGNDVQEDMVASEIGLNTYLVTDYLIDRGSPNYNIDQRGTLVDLRNDLLNKEGIFR